MRFWCTRCKDYTKHKWTYIHKGYVDGKAWISPRIHPTQKPIKLYSWIYQNYAEEGQKILDTHLGSGSNAIAAHYAKMG